MRNKAMPKKAAAVISTILKRAESFRTLFVRQPWYLEPDHGETWCWHCIDKLELKPGQKKCRANCDANHDSPETCERCQCWLHGWLTDWGAKEMLDNFEQEGYFSRRRGQDCWLWMLCETAFLEDSDEYRRLLAVAGIKES